jgi:hypothetical protein
MNELTRDAIMAMQPGRELDALVAERVFGIQAIVMNWPCEVNPDTGRAYPIQFPDPCDLEDPQLVDVVFSPYASTAVLEPPVEILPRYSTDIAAAWQVVEHLKPFASGRHSIDISWAMRLVKPMWCVEINGLSNALADTAPEAICKAALLAVSA